MRVKISYRSGLEETVLDGVLSVEDRPARGAGYIVEVEFIDGSTETFYDAQIRMAELDEIERTMYD